MTSGKWEKVQLPDQSLTFFIDPMGFHFGQEAIEIINFIPDKHYSFALDLGCGDSVLALQLLNKKIAKKVCAIDLQTESCVRSRKNAVLNELDSSLAIINADVSHIKSFMRAHIFDLIVTNPPFFAIGNDFPETSNSETKSRQEIHGNLRVFLNAAAFLLKKNADLILLYHPRRLDYALRELNLAGFTLKELQLIHHQDGRALFVFMRGVPGGKPGITVRPPKFLGKSLKHEVDKL